jgi:AraC-like DNA-binding protein
MVGYRCAVNISQLDVAIRAGAIVTILLVAWLLLFSRRPVSLAAALFVPLAVCVGGFVIGNTSLAAMRPSGLIGAIAHLTSGFTVIFPWWFSLACFESRFKLSGGLLGVGLAWAVIAGADRGMFGSTLADLELSVVLVALGFAIVGHLFWRLLSERQGDLIEARHDARMMVAILLGGMLFIDLAADAVLGFDWRPVAFTMTQNAMILAFGVWLAGRLFELRSNVLTFGVAVCETTEGGKIPTPGYERDAELLRRLTVLIDTHRLFLDPDLTFTTFVERMGASERAVRTLINHELGYDHFRTFLNRYRVAEACRLLADPTRANEKLVAIALDSGFASVASFNRAFRAMQECTPSQFQRIALQSDAPLVKAAI